MKNKQNFGTLEKLRQVAGTLYNSEVQEWKKNGGKVVGYFHSYIPEEIITAAGMMPFRLRGTGSTGTELSDSRFAQINCSFVRNSLNVALEGKVDFIDGIVAFDQCDQAHRLYEHWTATVLTPFSHYVRVPKKRGSAQNDYFRQELKLLIKKLEEHFKVEITDEKLNYAIKLHNETRHLQRKIYELRKKKNPPISGGDALAIIVAGTAIPKEKYNELLKKLLGEIGDSEGSETPSARLMLMGGDQDNPELVDVLESQGGMVVTDLMSFGTLIIWGNINETGDPLTAISKYYMEGRPACPRIFGSGPDRQAFIKELVDTYKVDGMISLRHPFCDMWGFEQENLSKFAEKINKPYLRLETEYILGNVGQMTTRVQAFIETLGEANHDK